MFSKFTSRLALVLSLALTILGTTGQVSAQATTTLAPEVSDHIDELLGQIEQGGIAANRAPVACTGICPALVDAEASATGSFVERLRAQQWLLRSKAWLLPVATELPPVDLMAGTAYAGYKIGSGLRALFTSTPRPAGASAAGIVTGAWRFAGQEIIGIGGGAPPLVAPTTGLVAADVNGNAKQWANWSGNCNVNPSGGTPSLGDFGAIVDQFGCPWGGPGWFSYTVGFKPASLTPPVTYTDQAIDSAVTWPSYNALVANPTAARVKDWVLDQLQEHPENYDELLPWLNWVLGVPGAPDPSGVHANHPSRGFPDVIKHWEDHHEEFDYDDLYEYWQAAADIVEKTEHGDNPVRYEHCARSNGDILYWDDEEGAFVIVSPAGNITTFFKPDDGKDYFDRECLR